jgi:hypothetical protein
VTLTGNRRRYCRCRNAPIPGAVRAYYSALPGSRSHRRRRHPDRCRLSSELPFRTPRGTWPRSVAEAIRCQTPIDAEWVSDTR